MIRRQLLIAAAGALSAVPALAQSRPVRQGDASSVVPDSGFSGRTPNPHLSPEQAAAFSKQVEETLAAKGARLAIVFRTGRPRDKLPDGISYTHGAFWAYVPIKLADGRTVNGYAVYNLYHGDGASLAKDRSYLAQDFPIDFVRGTAVDDVAAIIPSPEMQRRILAIMASPDYAKLHNPSYSLIANPLTPKHQNCNSFMLMVIAAAAWQTTDPAQLIANLRQHYAPTKVKVGPAQRLLGPMADSRLKTDDQPRGLVTATYESMAAFMNKNKLLTEALTITRVAA
jgi:hypothetical protein